MTRVPLGRVAARVMPALLIGGLGAASLMAAAQVSTASVPRPALPALRFAVPATGQSAHPRPDRGSREKTGREVPTTTATPVPSTAATAPPGTGGPAPTAPPAARPAPGAGSGEPGDDSRTETPATTVAPDYPVVTGPTATTTPGPDT